MEVGTLFRRVAREVNATTDGRQLPEISISLLGEFYFSPGAAGAAPGDGPAADTIAADYALAERLGTAAAWGAFLARYRDRPDELRILAALGPFEFSTSPQGGGCRGSRKQPNAVVAIFDSERHRQQRRLSELTYRISVNAKSLPL